MSALRRYVGAQGQAEEDGVMSDQRQDGGACEFCGEHTEDGTSGHWCHPDCYEAMFSELRHDYPEEQA